MRALFVYAAAVELIYSLYEWQLTRGVAQDMNALALGLLTMAILLPSGLVVPLLQWQVGQWLGYEAGDTSALLPRLFGIQFALLLNCLLLALIIRRLGKKAPKNDA